ncbi:MAG TPA: site-specific integrase [Streptosporangiaceae bacterium]
MPTPPAIPDQSRSGLPGETLTRRAVTVITAAIVMMAFAFSLGNVTRLCLDLGITAWIAWLVGPAVDLSVVATHAATESDTLACGTKPHAKAKTTEVGRELKEVTCRSCRTQLGLDGTDDANQRLAALFVLSITLGLRPGELRKLTWDLVDLDRGVVHVWRSASKSGDTKTPQSKRSLELPKRAITALKAHKARQDRQREAAGESWQGTNLVFCHEDGSMYTSDALNWRFSKTTRKAGLGHWHAHEGRHIAVSIMSSNGVSIQDISDTVGHKSSHVTETVYRHVIVPAIRGGATVMDNVFDDDEEE